MESQVKNWQSALRSWLQQHPKIMADDLQQLREKFVQKFPMENLSEMTLEQYAIGKPDSFCYWLEFQTKALGSISGGSAAKFGVWWSKSEDRWRWNSIYQSAEDALTHIKKGLLALIQAIKDERFDSLDKIGADLLGPNRYSLRSKPLYLYFPNQFLPISSPSHLKHFLAQFGKQSNGDLLVLNRQLLVLLRSLPQFAGFDTQQMESFLYDCLLSGQMTPSRTKVFISYSHKDAKHLERLQVHLAPYVHDKLIDVWDDTKIRAGAKWRNEIKNAIESSNVAVLLISADFLASGFIKENELPPLLNANIEDVIILPVLLSPCGFDDHEELSRYQAVNRPLIPLSKMNRHQKEDLWNKVAKTIKNPTNP